MYLGCHLVNLSLGAAHVFKKANQELAKSDGFFGLVASKPPDKGFSVVVHRHQPFISFTINVAKGSPPTITQVTLQPVQELVTS